MCRIFGFELIPVGVVVHARWEVRQVGRRRLRSDRCVVDADGRGVVRQTALKMFPPRAARRARSRRCTLIDFRLLSQPLASRSPAARSTLHARTVRAY